MKIGAVGLGSRIAHVFHELKKINNEAELIAYVDPQPIGKDYAIKNNFFPKFKYTTLKDMIEKESLDLLMIGSPNHLHLEHIKEGLNAGLKIFAEKPIVVDENQTAGFKTVKWDATNSNGNNVAAGMYIYQIKSGSYNETKKMILLK